MVRIATLKDRDPQDHFTELPEDTISFTALNSAISTATGECKTENFKN